MSKKVIDTTSIVNELEGASVFFKPSPATKPEPKTVLPKPTASQPPQEELPIASLETRPEPVAKLNEPKTTTDVRPSVRPYARTESVRIKRTITRYAFEFFQDQIESLKRFSLDEQIQGEKGSMSQMVREAIDSYIAKRRRTEE